jgi:hypothetical protein
LRKTPATVLCLGCAAWIARAQAQSVHLNTPQKDSGYLAGDVIHTEAIVTAAGHAHLDAISLPAPGQINASLDLIAIRSSETRGGGTTQISIEADYQTFLATDHVTESEIPGYDVRLNTGQIHVPAWIFHVSPLRTVQGTSGTLPALKPDHGLAPLPTAPVIARLLAALCCAALAAASTAFLRLRLTGFGHPLPFAKACREIARLRRANAPIESGFKSLHHAYAQTAGHRVFSVDLDTFIDAHRNFSPLARQTESFFAASHAQFFARTTAEAWSWEKLADLARALRRAERTRP